MTTTTSEIDDYVTAVHAALADLPDAEREDLLDDLPQHLADVQADRGGALVDLLGTPQDYAAELRATAGLATAGGRAWQLSLRERLARADLRLGAALGYERFADLVRALAPAWWLVRGWLVAEFVTGATGRSGRAALLPEIGGNRVAGIALLLVAVVASVWFGRRVRPGKWQRAVLVALGIALAAYGVVAVRQAVAPTTFYVQDGTDGVDGTDGPSNIYPVGADGTVLKNVRLYDQDGNPVVLGNAVCADDGSGVGDQVDGDGSGPATTSVAPSAAPSTDGAALYPLTCAANQGPFGPSSHAPALPSASAPLSTAPSTSPSPSAAPPTSPSASPVGPTPAATRPSATRSAGR